MAMLARATPALTLQLVQGLAMVPVAQLTLPMGTPQHLRRVVATATALVAQGLALAPPAQPSLSMNTTVTPQQALGTVMALLAQPSPPISTAQQLAPAQLTAPPRQGWVLDPPRPQGISSQATLPLLQPSPSQPTTVSLAISHQPPLLGRDTTPLRQASPGRRMAPLARAPRPLASLQTLWSTPGLAGMAAPMPPARQAQRTTTQLCMVLPPATTARV